MAAMASNNNKRKATTGAGVFDAIDALESQDLNADKKKKRVLQKDVCKSKAAQSQVSIFENLMELRILLQRVMQQQQQGKGSEEGSEEGSDNNNNTQAGGDNDETQELCQQLLSQLLRARSTLTGMEEQEYDDDNVDTAIASEYQNLKGDWKDVLNKRYKDLRLHSGLTAKAQFKLLDSDFWQQVESTSAYEINATGIDDNFDDSKVYQHMLQDFLLGKSKNSNMDVLKRKKNKKKTTNDVDRRASKGRKTRYTVLPKLVNFTFPQQRAETGMDEDEWFKSLFGGGQPRKV